MTKVKICGITTEKEALFLNEVKPDYMGIVLYFPKSKRNMDIKAASRLTGLIDKDIKKVAVTVSPTMDQLEEIFHAGFDFIQIHGEVSAELIGASKLPVIRAFNEKNIGELSAYTNNEKIAGLLFDAAEPGSGKSFDWTSLDWNLVRASGKTIFLAGGLNPSNVKNAIKSVKIDAVDVSSGVENDNGIGKDFNKIAEFINNARSIC